MKRILLFFGIFIFSLCGVPALLGQSINKITKVVIDAGHGGKDPGALGKYSKEKNITLNVALKTGELIEEYLDSVQVLFTRRKDIFVELHKRAQIANENGADVFISIHCNSNVSSQPKGAETYVMGLHKTQDNLNVAKTENAAIFYEEDYKTQYEGFDPNADEDYILLSMFQSSSIDESINLAKKVEDHLYNETGRRNRGVKQAGFWVLYKTTMPGILIELGFLSNPEEEKFLMSEKGQDLLAKAIFNAFKEYKTEFEDANKDVKPVAVQEPDVEKPAVFYRVQFTSYKKERSLNFRKFRGLKDVKMYKEKGMYKYTSGNFKSYNEAVELKKKLIRKGFKGAFIVAFVNGKKISLQEAKKLTEN